MVEGDYGRCGEEVDGLNCNMQSKITNIHCSANSSKYNSKNLLVQIHGEQPDVYHIYACIIAGLIYAYENENEGVSVKLTDEQFINLFTLLTISSGDPVSVWISITLIWLCNLI